jgi:lysophospholipase L1-like esterase
MKPFTLRLRKESLLTCLVFCLSIAATLVFCEVVLRFVLPSAPGNGYYIRRPHLKIVFTPYRDVMPGLSGRSEFITNSQGIRGDDPAPQDTYRILALGGSTTECGYLDQAKTWPSLLQRTLNESSRRLRVWVGNAGLSATTTRHHVIALQCLPLRELRIDTVILLVGINDFATRLSQDKQYDPAFMDKPEAKYDLVTQTFPGGHPSLPEDPFYRTTALFQLLRSAKRLMSRGNIVDEAGKFYIAVREHRRNASKILDELPDLSSALAEYARNINRIIDITQEKSLRVILLTQPTMWRPDLPKNLDALLWFGGVGDFFNTNGTPYYSVASLETGIGAYNRTLLRICRERRVECLDLAPMLEKDTTVFYDDVHFNESGARKVAQALSRYLLEREPFRE